MKRTFEALATAVSLEVDADVADGELAWMTVAAYPDSTHVPELAFQLRGGAHPALVCAGKYETPVEDAADLVPLFELDLYHALVEHAPPGWILHAAAVEHAGRTLVLAGPSGAGKTTLTLALVARGWRMSSDEIVHLDRDVIVRGLARPIHAQSTRSLAIPAGWPRRPYPMRGQAGAPSLLVQPPPEVRVVSPLVADALVRIGHGPDIAPSLERLPAHRALPALWSCALRGDDDGLALATQLVARVPAFELASASVDDAVRLIERLVTT